MIGLHKITLTINPLWIMAARGLLHPFPEMLFRFSQGQFEYKITAGSPVWTTLSTHDIANYAGRTRLVPVELVVWQ